MQLSSKDFTVVAAFVLMEMYFGTGVLWQLIHSWNSCLNLGTMWTVSVVFFCMCCLHAIDEYNFYGWQSFDYSYQSWTAMHSSYSRIVHSGMATILNFFIQIYNLSILNTCVHI